MVAYGGAGPLHAGLVTRELRIPTVIIAPSLGHFSACGMLVADRRRDFVRTWFMPLVRRDFVEREMTKSSAAYRRVDGPESRPPGRPDALLANAGRRRRELLDNALHHHRRIRG